MSQKVSQALLSLLNEITNNETMLSKIRGAIFAKKSENLMKEKVSYLYNLLQVEAETYNQKNKKQFDEVSAIMDKYRKKLNLVYQEMYLQYVNIQSEIGEAKINQKVAMINYQKIINESEKNQKPYLELKEKIKDKNEQCEEIIEKCEKQFQICLEDFQEQINTNFFIESNIQIADENNFFYKIKKNIINFFDGTRRYKQSLARYEAKIDNINTEEMIKKLREKTIDFVADILEIKYLDLEKAV